MFPAEWESESPVFVFSPNRRMMSNELMISRRTVLTATGAIATVGLAGCTGGSGGSDGGGSGGDEGGEEATDSPTEGSSSPDFDGWFDNVDNYDGVVDRTGTSEVTVAVGAEGNGGNFAFEPAAVRVSTGTTVVWEWTGKGSSHNVVAEDGAFESELTDEEGFTFEQTFESAGMIKYACTPHKSVGMKGAVVVE